MIDREDTQGTYQANKGEHFDPSLRELLQIIWQRRGVAMLAATLVFLIGTGFVAQWRPDYRASAEIGLSTDVAISDGSSSEGMRSGNGVLTAQQIETVIAEIKGEENLITALSVLRGSGVVLTSSREANSVISGLIDSLSVGQEAVNQHPDETDLANRLRAGLDLERIGNAAVVEVGFVAHAPDVAKAGLTAIVESYVWQREDRQRRALRQQLSEARVQFDAANAELVMLEGVLAAREQQAGVLDADENARILDRIYALDEQAEKLGQEVAEYRLISESRNSSGGLDDLLTISEIANHPVVSQLTQQLESKEQEFIALDQRYGPKHPTMQGREAELLALRQELGVVVGNVSDQLDLALGSAQEKLRLITRQRNQWEAKIAARNNSMQGQAALLRSVVMARDDVSTLGQRVLELQREMAAFAGDIVILRSASLPGSAEFPGKRDLMLLVGMLSVLTAAVAAMLRHYFDQNVRDDFDAERNLGVQIYARMPMWTNPTNPDDTASDEAGGHLAVLMRILAQKGDGGGGDGDGDTTGQVVALCSAASGDGKSHIAHALATKLSAMGHSVVLLDADLHDPAVSDAGIRQGDLTAVLAGECSLDQALGEAAGTGYQRFSSPVAVPGQIATGLIEGKLPEVVEVLRQRLDHVIVDTPPILAVADGLVAARLADVSLMILRSGQSKRRDIGQALDQLRAAGVTPHGIVLNGARSRPAYGKSYEASAKAEPA
jgi:uncharacterized protein involved in exopolysaccharide biosynthesis/MinD-like ATPase involved in chromosome partitioning or flagellar assembly